MIGRRILLVAMVVCFVFMPQGGWAQRIIAVEVVHEGDDSVGQRLAYQVKESIRRSARRESGDLFKLTNIDESRLIIYLVTADEFEKSPGAKTIYGVTYTFTYGGGDAPKFITSGVGSCGADQVNKSAESLVANIDKVLSVAHRTH
jgi:hypothetical protein